MFQALVHRAGGLDKVVEKDVGPLILQAFASNSTQVIDFLICECNCDVPTAIDDVRLYSVMEVSVVHSSNVLFNTLFKLYCSRKNLEYVESPPNDQDDHVGRLYKSFSYAYNFVEQEEMFNPPAIDTEILNLLRKSFKNTNIHAALLLMKVARMDINRFTYPFIVKSMEESKLKDVAVHWECEDNLINLIDAMDDPSRTDPNGKTLLHIALENNCFRIVQYLIDKEMFPLHQADTINRWSAFHYCLMEQSTIEKKYQKIQYELETRRKLFTHMMEKDPIDCITSRDAAGRNLLHLAVINGHYSQANDMLEPILKDCTPEELESKVTSILSQSSVTETARFNFNLKRLEKIDSGFYCIDG
ncbi:AGAP012173-PA-like protein [Anopheles sinensis]|uniref:AGAP012173-PA-like protein n=1 Tax=Anopheles sinensis TaxID=74873 RepID=A0A084VI02_ANOSI|nr:AGAP012173-PA-like protein [Anopheles sinensis]